MCLATLKKSKILLIASDIIDLVCAQTFPKKRKGVRILVSKRTHERASNITFLIELFGKGFMQGDG